MGRVKSVSDAIVASRFCLRGSVQGGWEQGVKGRMSFNIKLTACGLQAFGQPRNFTIIAYYSDY